MILRPCPPDRIDAIDRISPSGKLMLLSNAPRGHGEKRMAECKALRTDGSKCGAQALRGGDFCFFHDPDSRTSTVEAAHRGLRPGPWNYRKVDHSCRKRYRGEA